MLLSTAVPQEHLQTSRADVVNLASRAVAMYGHTCGIWEASRWEGNWFWGVDCFFVNPFKDEFLVTPLPCWHYMM